LKSAFGKTLMTTPTMRPSELREKQKRCY